MDDSLEEKVSVFLDEDFLQSHDPFDDEFDQSSDNNLHNSIERTLFWESQEALLQEVLEGYNATGSKVREEINRIIEKAKESEKCYYPNASFRQCVVSLLSQRGFNASLCTSVWKHTKKFPGGKHEYIEVMVSTSKLKKQIPYVIELEFREQFQMAKASQEYNNLISLLPKYYIGKSDYLNVIVGIVCESAKTSMKEKKIYMGPWRKRSFMQMKWSSSSSSTIRDSIYESPSKFTSLSSTESRDCCFHFSAAPPAVIVT